MVLPVTNDEAKRGETIQDAIRQTKPFVSPSQEAFVGLMLTTERLRWPLADLLARHGDLTAQQYNVLRILRGAGSNGLPTLEIAARMIERTPGITRMLDRLERKGLVERERAAEDRRQVWCRISKPGLDLLRSLDEPIEELDARLMAPLSESEVVELIRLLDKVRNGLE
ncbi:MAG: MarR family transcriptional regulator [Planctomycetes bacterium]|nr:MarR family transcriptional regulator [Planctomycetota bacterium]